MANQLQELFSAKRQKISSDLQLEQIPIDGYEHVLKITNPSAGLIAIIAMHNTVLGPALGGTRIYPYASFESALEDVLRLAKGMTYKSAISEVGLGVGRSVIIADPKKAKSQELLLSFGEAVESLKGQYICAEDVGCNTEDVKIIRQKTKYVTGLPNANSSGDPSRFTAWGVFRGIQATAKTLFGSDSLEGKRVAIQGTGNVGCCLADYLFWAGAELILADADMSKAEKLACRYGCKTSSPEQILYTECDILAPCALGGILNDETIPLLRCSAIAGAANNQLLRDVHAARLRDRNILYAPDFLINAGGLLNVASELHEDGYSHSEARAKTHRIYDTLLAIYEIAQRNQESTQAAAIALAEYRLKYAIGKRTQAPAFHHVIE